MELPTNQIKYCLYARKSSEDDERQALSIDSQIKEMTNLADNAGLKIIEIRKESHSAKNSNTRPVFNKLIEDINNKVFQGILSWAPDRLSRNAGDLGTLVDLMDRGILTEIRTHGQVFTNSPNDKFLLMILCSQAKLENDNRGVNVKRGMRTKCEMGYRPNMTPLGYLNDKTADKGCKKVYPDPDRAKYIKQSFEKVAYENYTGRKIYKWLKDKTNFRTRSGKIISLSMIYRILSNSYYTGIFESPINSGNWYKGSYEPIISKELFKAVQDKLAQKSKTKYGTKQKKFIFTRLIKCGNCGSGITAHEIVKIRKRGPKQYIYYHCTKLKDFTCFEPYINENNLAKEIINILTKRLNIDQLKSNDILYSKFEQFNKFRSEILNMELKENEVNLIDLKNINLKKFIEHIFEKGTIKEKRELVSCFNTPLYLKDRKIIIK